MFERFTARARRVLVLAQEEARLLDHPAIGTEHVLLGIVHVNDGVTGKVLEPLALSVETVRAKVEQLSPPGAGPAVTSPPFTARTKMVLELSLREALALGHSYIGPEHFLLGLIREGEGTGVAVLNALGVDLDEVHAEILAGIDHREESATTGGPGTGSRLATCSFCGRRPPDTGQLVVGNEAFICEQCVRQWATRFLIRERRQRLLSPPPVSGPPPADEIAARTAIERAVADFFTIDAEGAVPAVEDGSDLGRYLEQAAGHPSVPPDTLPDVVVDAVVFENEDQAAVWFTIWVDGEAMLTRHRGDALRVDGDWKVSRATFCDVMARAGVLCPLRSDSVEL
ncbi:MAG TPA: Clp protease N-terminal domain-containing protein [Acidimicrobiales bacterium]|nr:Clp protease N-terminal domain-containing protein [Acidimicrobiales bacterium]